MSDRSPERDERIRARAYEMWEQEGRQEGRAEHYWHRAREELEPPSGSLDDQLSDTFPASDPPSITSPSYPDEPLPAAPQDEALPARSATGEERPEPAAGKPGKMAKPGKKAAREEPAAPQEAAKPAKSAAKAKAPAKPRKS